MYYAVAGSIIAFICYCAVTVFVLDCIVDWISTMVIRHRQKVYRKRHKNDEQF